MNEVLPKVEPFREADAGVSVSAAKPVEGKKIDSYEDETKHY